MFSNTQERNSWLTIALLKPAEYSEKQVGSSSGYKKRNIEKKIPDDISWWSWKGGPPTKK